MSGRPSWPARLRAATVTLLACLSLVALAACGTSSKPDPSASSTQPRNAGLPPLDTAAASIRLEGAKGLAGELSVTKVQCGMPGLRGATIALTATPRDKSLNVRITIEAKGIVVAVSGTSNKTFHQRAFHGSGVKDFDAQNGVTIKSTLKENPGASKTLIGPLGTMSSVSGEVDCGNQAPGHSTIRFTGKTSLGSLSDAVLDPVKVMCTTPASGHNVEVIGLATSGKKKLLLYATIRLTSFTVVVTDENNSTEFFTYTKGAVTADALGASVDADAAGSATAYKLHLAGEANCANRGP